MSYERCLEQTEGNHEAAATLYLAEVLNRQLKDIDHQICMGIRHGLFGTAASDHSSIDAAINRTSETQ